MTKKLKYIGFIIFIFITYKNSLACTCSYIDDVSAEALIYDGIVFKGKIIDLKTEYSYYDGEKYPSEKFATFIVDSWYTLQEVSDTVIVNTGIGGGDCGLFFNKGDTWLIYATINDGIISSSNCTASTQSTSPSFRNSIKYLESLKLKTGQINEKIQRGIDEHMLSGNIEKGKPIGKWVRISKNDTIAIFNFDDEGKRQGYQMEKHNRYYTSIVYYETTDSYVKVFNSEKQLEVFYELVNGKRDGKYEKNFSDGYTLIVKGNYKNGRLVGEWISWHEDKAFAEGLIKTIMIFDNDVLKSSKSFDESTGKEIKY